MFPKIILSLVVGLAFVGSLTSCHEIYQSSVTYATLKDTTYVSATVDAAQSKVVLIEEFTGVKCTNCPKGHIQLAFLDSTYPNNLSLVGIHSNLLADPYDGDQDLRSQRAEDISSFLGAGFKPSAAIDRLSNSGTNVFSLNDWQGKVATELAKTTPVNIYQRIFVDSNTGNQKLELKIVFTQTVSNQVSLGLYFVESGIKTTQLFNGAQIPNYEQKHVMRLNLTKIEGDPLLFASGSSYEKGRTYLKVYDITANPDWKTSWVFNNCSAVAFVMNTSDGTVIQSLSTPFH